MTTMKHDVLAERTYSIVRSILPDVNACGTLMNIVAAGGDKLERYLVEKVQPTLKVYEDEADMRKTAYSRLSQESEERRQALEFIAANAWNILPPEAVQRVSAVLGRDITAPIPR